MIRRLGAVGQVNVAGFSPIGVDVFNFPQRRVNNTYQVADGLTMRVGAHAFAFGADTRRSELNSLLPRNARPLITFAGAPAFDQDINFVGFTRPETLVAASAPSGFYQTIALNGETALSLRYYQLNFYAQDTWRVRPTLTLAYGLRYEYNTPPRETHRAIENTFNDPALNLVPGLSRFIGNRTSIFNPDKNNFAPRVSFAYSPDFFGRERRTTVIRAGYGLFYDQILGAVVSQSRNVYPSYLTVNFAGGLSNLAFIPGREQGTTLCPASFSSGCPFLFLNPSNPIPNINNPNGALVQLVQPGTLNNLNPSLTFAQAVNFVNAIVRGGGSVLPPLSGFGATIPTQQMATPLAHHFDLSFEQQLGRNLALSVSYVGTRGRHLLRFTTPNLGPNAYIVPTSVFFIPPVGGSNLPALSFQGLTLPPGVRVDAKGEITPTGRPVSDAGTIYQFETSASSNYNALQLQLRSRIARRLQLQTAYTFSKATDDVSDVFDLAGASSLPQDSFNLAGERGPANFDARHRFAYNFILDLPRFGQRGEFAHALLGGWQLSSLGSFQTGQPFTVNSIFDV
ncbi:MAG TPA: hypothetical protein VE821_16105, partial [Pyrinomonadaceae bacterium]|nr:hypothetical protein [Pyrinomonadaceae bacterium]